MIQNFVRARSVVRVSALALAAASFSVVSSGSASAQAGEEADNGDAGENVIIVTARKQEEDVQDVPIAITAFSGETFQDAGLVEFTDVAKLTPNFDARPNATAQNLVADLNIRGQTSAFFTVNSDQAVGIIVNGAPITRGTSLFSNLFDVEQIEVLKGPQGTLFGKNTIGGVVSVTTTAPKLGEFSGYGEVTVGNFDRIDAEAVLNVPLGDTVAARFGAAITSRDGFGQTTQAFSPGVEFELADDDEIFFRGSLLVEPNDSFSLRINADYHENNEAPSIQRTLLPAILQIPLPPPLDPLMIPLALPSGDPDFFAGLQHREVQPFADAEEFNINATATLDLGGATLTSITSYREQESLINLQFAPTTEIFLGQDSDIFAQELRLNGSALGDRLSWQGGAFYSSESGVDLDVLPGAGLFEATAADNETFSLFTQGTFALTDQLNLTAGVRWTTEDRAVSASGPITLGADGLPTGFSLGAGDLVEVSNTFDGFSWLVSLDYSPTEDVLLYASISRGFRSGGIDQTAVFNISSDPALNVGDVETNFLSEFVTNFEVGFKSDFLDNRVRFNASGFYTDFDDPQLLDAVPVSDEAGGGLITILANAGSAELMGFEAELTAEPVDDLTLGGTVGYVDGELADFVNAVGVDQNGFPIGGRNWTFTLSGRYETDISEGARLGFQANFFWFGSEDVVAPEQLDLFAGDAGILPSYNILNAQIDLDLDVAAGLNIAVFGTNLTDEEFFVSGANFNFGPGALIANRTVGDPRTYGIRIRQNF